MFQLFSQGSSTNVHVREAINPRVRCIIVSYMFGGDHSAVPSAQLAPLRVPSAIQCRQCQDGALPVH